MLKQYMYVILCCLCLNVLSALEWQAATETKADATLPSVPFGQKPDKPQLQLTEHQHPADVFLWQSIKGLHLHITVKDEAFEARSEKKWLWKGDCLYLEIDGHGDNPNTYAMGSDDLQLFYALSADGPHGKISDHGHPHLRGELSKDLFNCAFDESAQLFTYQIFVPWKYLNSGPGLNAQCGVAINVAHKGSEKKDNVLGQRGNKRRRTRGLISLQLEKPTQTHVFIGGFDKQPLLSANGSVDLAVSVQSDKQHAIRARIGEHELPMTHQANEALRGWIKVKQSDLQYGDVVELFVDEKSHKRQISSLQKNHQMIHERLGKSDRTNPVAALHVDSLRALATDCMTRSSILGHNDPKADYNAWLTKIFKWQQRLLKTLPAAGFDLRSHLISGKPLALAFVASSDGSLQFASLQLPHDFDSAKTYPLVCYLHGYGPKTPVDYLDSLENNSGQDTLWLEGTDEKVRNSGQRQCILVSPFGRGSIGYKHQAEKDVWQSLEIAHKHFKIDEDRRYLSGFSMGCDGTFSIAARKPDYWAAINLSAGFHTWGSTWHSELYVNLKDLPVIVWCGDQDKRMYDGLKKVLPLWEKSGLKPVHQTIAPGLPHTYPYYSYSDMLLECFKYTRSAKESFSYRLPKNDGSTWSPLSCHGFQAVPFRGVEWHQVAFTIQHKDNVFTIAKADNVDGFRVNTQEFNAFARSCDRERDVQFLYKDKTVYQGSFDKLKYIKLPKSE